jgi:hypothetical protein
VKVGGSVLDPRRRRTDDENPGSGPNGPVSISLDVVYLINSTASTPISPAFRRHQTAVTGGRPPSTAADFEREKPVDVVTSDRAGRRDAVDRETADALLEARPRFDDGDVAVGVFTGSDGTDAGDVDQETMVRLTFQSGGSASVARARITRRWNRPTLRGRRPRDGIRVRPPGRDAAEFGEFERRIDVPLVDGESSGSPGGRIRPPST